MGSKERAGRGGEPHGLAGWRNAWTGLDVCCTTSQKSHRCLPECTGVRRGRKEGWPLGMTSEQRTFVPEEGNEGTARILTW